jgi:hypothetical protein
MGMFGSSENLGDVCQYYCCEFKRKNASLFPGITEFSDLIVIDRAKFASDMLLLRTYRRW